MNDQRFRVSFNGTDWEVLNPLNTGRISFKQERDLEAGQVFFRQKINTALIWGGEAFKKFWAIEKNEAKQCDEILVVYEERCRGRWRELWRGKFATGRGRFNLDLCEFHVTPETVDRYTCVLERQGRKVNLMHAPPTDVMVYPTPSIEALSMYAVPANLITGTWRINAHPGLGLVDGEYSSIPAPEKWWLGHDFQPGLAEILGTPIDFMLTYWRERVSTECVAGEPVSPAGSGWELLEACNENGMAVWVREPTFSWSFGNPVHGTCMDDIPIAPDAPCPVGWTNVFPCGVTTHAGIDGAPYVVPPYFSCLMPESPVLISRARTLESCLQVLLDRIECGIDGVRSDFFEINPMGDAPGYTPGINYVTGQPNQVDNIVLLQKSDAKYPNASNPATIGEMTFKEMMQALYVMFRVLWDIDDDGYLRIEHWKYWNYDVGLDLPAQREVIEPLDYQHISDNLPRVERGTWMEALGRDFVGRDIVYSGPCIGNADANTQEKSWTPGKISTDISFILSDSAAISNDGFVFLATQYDGSEYVTIIDAGAITGNYTANAPLSWANLQRDFWTWDRPFREGNMNGADTVFDGHLPTMRQEGVGYAVCCDIFDFDPKDRVSTKLGKLLGKTGTIETAEYNIHDRRMRMVLLYGGPEPTTPTAFTCVGPGMVTITVDEGVDTNAGIGIYADTGYFAVRKPDGEVEVLDSYFSYLFHPVQGGAGAGTYCIWPSDAEGEYSAEAGVSDMYIYGPGVSFSAPDFPMVDWSWGVVFNSLSNTSIDFSGFPALASYGLFNCSSLAVITGYDLSNCSTFHATGCALSQATVDAIILAAAASGNTIYVDLSGGTSAPPSSTTEIDDAIDTIVANGGYVTHN